MTALGFTITFHSPFRVGAAYARDGVDAAVDREDPLPADSLKGLMRAAARELLGGDHRAVGAVFGTSARPSAWSWSAARPPGRDWAPSDLNGSRHRVTIDPDKHSVVKDQLVLGEQVWVPSARFEVTRVGYLDSESLPEAVQVLVLRCAAGAVHGLGAWRRRGLGWAGIVPDDGEINAADVARLLVLAGEGQ
jgi:CRISPR/Cas system CSM-associated protein Csm3 (group 7 of RAMP superfamily)